MKRNNKPAAKCYCCSRPAEGSFSNRPDDIRPACEFHCDASEAPAVLAGLAYRAGVKSAIPMLRAKDDLGAIDAIGSKAPELIKAIRHWRAANWGH